MVGEIMEDEKVKEFIKPRAFNMYTVYDHPSDYPNDYVCRRLVISPGEVKADCTFLMVTKDLELIRGQMLHMGLTLVPRDPSDDPVVIESYI